MPQVGTEMFTQINLNRQLQVKDPNPKNLLSLKDNGDVNYTSITAINSTINLGLTENPPEELNTTTYDAFPMLFQTHSGKVILVHKQGVAHQGPGESGIRISTDGGETYGPFISLANVPDKYNGISGGGVTPNGRIILFYFVATTGVGTNEIGYMYSDDDAVTWSEKIPLSAGGDLQGGWTGKMIVIGEDKLMQCRWGAPSLFDPTTWNTKVYAIFSEDNGETWGDEVVIASGSYAENKAYTECSFVYLEGGNIVGLIRKEDQSYFEQFKSEDNGLTWTAQGDATFDYFAGYPGAPEVQTYIDTDGKKTVVAYYSNRNDLWVRSILGRNLLSGTSGWIQNTRTNIRQNNSWDSGYPSVIHPNGSHYGLGVYYESKTLSDSDIRFFKSRPDNSIIFPQVGIFADEVTIQKKLTVNDDAKIGGDIEANVVNGSLSISLYRGANKAAYLGSGSGNTGLNGILQLYDTVDVENVRFYASGNSWIKGGNVGIGTDTPIYALDVAGIERVKRFGVNGLGGGTVLLLASDAKTIGDGVILTFRANNSSNEETTYAGITASIVSPTAGSQSGKMLFRTYLNGEITEAMQLTEDGRASVKTAPIDPTDVVRKMELDDLFTDPYINGNLNFTDGSNNLTFIYSGQNGNIILPNGGTLATLGDLGNLKDGTLNKTSNYTILATDYGTNGTSTVFVDATAGAVTITLQTAALMNGKTVNVVKTDVSANSVTVKGNGTTNINASNTYVISAQFDNVSVKSNGTQYYIMS